MNFGQVSSAHKAFNNVANFVDSRHALNMIKHGQEIRLNVTTPVGTQYRGVGLFIGKHSSNIVLIETPDMSPIEIQSYFQEGFWVNITAYSFRGEGAIIQFRAQIENRITHPFQALAFKVPERMKMSKLRRENRYEVNLCARLYIDQDQEDCEIVDLSRSGCRISITSDLRQLLLGEALMLDVYAIKNEPDSLITSLQGEIRNLQHSSEDIRYGIEFNDRGKEQATRLFNKLRYDGEKLHLRS